MIIQYFNDLKMTTCIWVDSKNRKIKIKNFTDDLIDRAFGIIENPTWADFMEFLESRCLPRARDHLQEQLQELGLTEYDPLAIVKKTNGKMYGDNYWLRIIESEDEI